MHITLSLWPPRCARLVFSLALGMTTSCSKDADLRAPAIGASAPVFEVADLSGTPVTLASLKGQVVVLNVWATWCSPCIEEIPQLENVHTTFGTRGVTTVGVSIDAAGMGADVKDFMTEHHMTYRVWLDPDNSFATKFLTVGVPETFVLDRKGTIRWRATGALRAGDTAFVGVIQRALAER
jgi:cytochrome c biogenesis protein CcmG, thiol:disulfide interchange protein DsbE